MVQNKENLAAPALCPVYRKCGGCQMHNLSYEQQLAWKQSLVVRLLRRFGKVNPIIGMQTPTHYRNKVQAAFGLNSRGECISGVYQSGTHRIVPIDDCLIEDRKADEIIVTIRNLTKSFKITPYDERTQTGLLRHVLVRRGFASGEIMVVLVTATPIFPSKKNFVTALLKKHPEITTILQNVNPYATSLVLGPQEKTLFGKGTIEDTLCGCIFRLSAKSFYQINPVQTELLYQKAIALAGLTGKETVIDAYCGIGTIGLIAAKQAKQVIGVENNRDAVRDAIANAKRNQIQNIYFYAADASAFLRELAQEGAKIDVVFLDPPRAGSDKVFLQSLCRLAPKRVVYISCNPETLARDLAFLVTENYVVQEIQPVDMFPYTHHVETVVLMSRVNK